jgi:peptidoglycan-N-acetylglucosamine deacetylase
MTRLFGLIFLLCSSLLHAQTLSFSFDDGLDPRTNGQASTLNTAILSALGSAGVKAMIFPAGKIVDSPAGMELVRAWGEAGHAVGNHTYAHTNYGSARMSLTLFTQDILRGEELLGQLPGWTNRLRFPYLKEGETHSKHRAIHHWLDKHQYRPAPVSIDTSDWYYDECYTAWRKANPDADPEPFRRAYLDHLWDRANYYDALSLRLLGRHPLHVMLLHTNAVNAAFLPDVITMFRDRGWKIVATSAAFSDPLYARRPTTIPAGESIVWSLAKQNGVRDLRYPAEEAEYEKPRLAALHLLMP